MAIGKVASVIGATGLVGRALVDQLAAASHISRVIAVTRRPLQQPSPKVKNHIVDFDRLEEYAEAFQGDYFFSCLGTTLKQAGSIEAQRKVDLDYQFRAAQLAASNGVPHYLLVSSSMAAEESSNPYLRMKGELEKKVLALPFKRISIFQPSLLIGSREVPRLGETLASWMMPAVCTFPGLRRYRPIRGEEVAAKMVQVSQGDGEPLEWFRLDEVFP